MNRQTTEHRQVVIAAMIAVMTTLMIMMLTAQKAHATTHIQTLGSSNISHCGMLPAGAASHDYTKRARNVRIIQTKLTRLGYGVGNAGIDGIYGKDTKAATARFQKEYNLNADARVGSETATTLAFVSHPAANVRRCKTHISAFRHY